MWDNVLIKKFSHKRSRGQIILRDCPYCGNDNFNLEVSVEKGVYHCWICDSAGRVQQLFLELGLPFVDDGMEITPQKKKKDDDLTLRPFHKIKWETHSKFLKSRGLEKADIEKYNLLTTDKGKFRNKIIFPLYEGKELVYVVARDITPKGKYQNLNVSRSGILPFYKGKNMAEIYLCEGILDAISVNKLGFTVVILLGTILTNEQLRKITSFEPKSVVISLDGDVVQKALKIYDKVHDAGIKTKMVWFAKKDDPNSVFVRDKAELKYTLKEAREVTLTDRVKLKIK